MLLLVTSKVLIASHKVSFNELEIDRAKLYSQVTRRVQGGSISMKDIGGPMYHVCSIMHTRDLCNEKGHQKMSISRCYKTGEHHT